MRVGIFFTNFGPYHTARIAALARRCTVLPVEIKATSSEYLWGEGAFQSFTRTTLVSSSESGTTGQLLIQTRLRETLTHLRPDVLAIPGWWEPASLAAIQWARPAGVPVVMMSESTRQDERRRPHKEYIKRQIISMCSSAIVGGTRHASYVQELGMDASRVWDGYDVVDNEHFSRGAAVARKNADAVRRDLKLPAHYFLASSRFIPRKNLLRLIAGYDLYRRQTNAMNAWSLVILGYGEQEEIIRAEVQRRGLSAWIRLPGFQPYDHLPAYYGLAGAFVHPALSEPWGLVVNEALAAGVLPIVSKTCGCAPDLVADGETGFQFDPEDVHQLSLLMTRVAYDQNLRDRLSKNAENRIKDWGPDRFATNLVAAAQIAVDLSPVSPALFANACLWTLLRRAS